MVEILNTDENRNKALDVYRNIQRALLPAYLICPSQSSVVTDFLEQKGELDCYIEQNTHKKLFFLNKKIGRLVYDGDGRIGIRTDDQEKVNCVAKILENLGYSVMIIIKDSWK